MPKWVPEFFRWGAAMWFFISVLLFAIRELPEATYMAVGAVVLLLAAREAHA